MAETPPMKSDTVRSEKTGVAALSSGILSVEAEKSITLGVAEQTESSWSERDPEDRQQYLQQLDQNYFAIVDEFLQQSNLCVKRFQELTASHTSWRRRMTWLTGGLAITNVIIAYVSANSGTEGFIHAASVSLPLAAAIYAAVISIFSNLESLNNFPQQAQVFREAREWFLDALREFEMLWYVHVQPFHDSPIACINAARLYRRIVIKDHDLRRQVKEMTETQKTPTTKTAGD
jgi:hypothetical protein